MNNSLAQVIAKSGILDEATIGEFRKWGLPVDQMSTGPRPQSAEQLVASLEEALQSEGLILEKVTDLEIVRQYLATQRVGTLHVEIGSESSEFQLVYGRTSLGEYILQWKGDSISDEMTNGLTYLQTEELDKVFFSNVHELYFGDKKAFMTCSPSGSSV